MASFRFCETHLLHIKPFVVNKSAISPFLCGSIHPRTFAVERCSRAMCTPDSDTRLTHAPASAFNPLLTCKGFSKPRPSRRRVYKHLCHISQIRWTSCVVSPALHTTLFPKISTPAPFPPFLVCLTTFLPSSTLHLPTPPLPNPIPCSLSSLYIYVYIYTYTHIYMYVCCSALH